MDAANLAHYVTLAAIVVTAVASFIGGTLLERQRSREWARKERWTFKRDTYVEVFRCVSVVTQKLADWYQAADRLDVHDPSIHSDDTRRLRKIKNERIELTLAACSQLLETLARTEAFCSRRAADAIDTMRKELFEVREHVLEEPEWISGFGKRLREIEAVLREEARKDFESL